MPGFRAPPVANGVRHRAEQHGGLRGRRCGADGGRGPVSPCQGPGGAGLGRAGRAPGASSGGERGPRRRGGPPSPLRSPRRAAQRGRRRQRFAAAPAEERRGATRPKSQGKSFPAGRRPRCSCEGFPLDVCTASDN